MAKRWRRILVVAFLVVALALVLLVFGGHSGPRFGDTISFLKGKESNRTQEILHVPALAFRVARVKPKDPLWVTDTYVFEEPFSSLNERAKAELKPRSFVASAYPKKDPTYQSYAIKDKTGRTFTVTLNKDSATRTTVVVSEWKDATWIDEAKDWVKNLFHPKETGQTITLR